MSFVVLGEKNTKKKQKAFYFKGLKPSKGRRKYLYERAKHPRNLKAIQSLEMQQKGIIHTFNTCTPCKSHKTDIFTRLFSINL